MEAALYESTVKSHRPRNPRACERCRRSKARCEASDQLDQCRRCLAMNQDCTWTEAPRPAKKIRGPSRISKVEEKIDGLVAHFTGYDTPISTRSVEVSSAKQQTKSPVQPHGSLSTPQEPSAAPFRYPNGKQRSETTNSSVEHLAQLHSFEGHEGAPTFNISSRKLRDIESAITSHTLMSLVENGSAFDLFNDFTSMSPSFPFVPINLESKPEEILAQKPMLFMAIVTVASWQQKNIQRALEEDYRREVSRRVVCNIEQSLSIAQSILVYLAWNQHFFTPKAQYVATFLQIAMGILVDLNIGHTKHLKFPFRARKPQSTPAEERAEQRALLGCYYLDSAFGGALHKTNTLRYTAYMSECCESLTKEPEFETDKLISYLIQLRQVEDRIHDELFTDTDRDPENPFLYKYDRLRMLEAHMRDLRAVTWVEEPNRRLCDLMYHIVDIELHSIGIHTYTDSNGEDVAGSSTVQAAQLEVLLACLEAGKSFLDTLLACPASDYPLISFVEWMRLPQTIATVAMMSLKSEKMPPYWDVKLVQDRARLDLYLESLCFRMQELTTFKPPEQPFPDYWMTMKMILSSVRGWYSRRVRAAPGGSGNLAMTKLSDLSVSHHHASMDDTRRKCTPSDGPSFPYQQPTWSPPNISFTSSGIGNGSRHYPFNGTQTIEYMPTTTPDGMMGMEFSLDQYLDMDFWGGV